jgi:hypothetical protein
MLVLNTTSPPTSPGPVKDRQAKVRPSSNASIAFIFVYSQIRLFIKSLFADAFVMGQFVIVRNQIDESTINPFNPFTHLENPLFNQLTQFGQPRGAFSIKFHIPHGQAPAQKPHPMQRSADTIYSKRPSGASVRLMALSGQIATQMPQSRH